MPELQKTITDNLKKHKLRNNAARAFLDNKQWAYLQHRHDLTPRERDIAELVCLGMHNYSIARHLNIQPGTVKTHLRNIYRKIHVNSKITMLLAFINDAHALYPKYPASVAAKD